MHARTFKTKLKETEDKTQKSAFLLFGIILESISSH